MHSRPRTVLHIDDDEGLTRLVSKALARRDFEVENVATGAAGLARIDAGGIDAVVLDHYLASETGLSVLKALMSRTSAPPVVYVTGSSEASIAVEALKAGATDYVHKTVGEDFFVLLASAVDQAIETDRLQKDRERAEQEIRAARDRAEILLAEVNHRVANSLALVAALVRMQSSTVTDPTAKGALAETEARISAIASLHRKLYTSDDVHSVSLDSYLESLVKELDASMQATGHRSRVKLDVEPVSLPTDKAVSVGMIVTELLTNAYKYAYPGGVDGEVRVLVKRAGERKARLTVEDDGIGWDGTGPAKGTGLGTRIVKAMAVNLGTSIDYGGGKGGTRTSMELELADE